MRTLDEIRKEMADAAYYAKISQEAGAEMAAERHLAVYGALEWVLQEPWKVTGEFEAKKTVHQQYLTDNDTKQIETTIWSDGTMTYIHRTRTSRATTNWSDWQDGKGE